MYTLVPRCFVAAVVITQTGCSLNPAWLFDDFSDYDSKRGMLMDTPKNRNLYFDVYASHARREAAGEKVDWVGNWRSIFAALERHQDNPELYKSFIISERRKHGLPDLPFAK